MIRQRKPLRRESKRRAAERTKYRKLREQFLQDNPWCAYHLAMNPPRHVPATEIHHSRGRAGRLYLDTRFWIPLSAEGHDWVHNHMDAARHLGLLCDVGEWNKPAPHGANP